ncbi:hypothetical protein V2H45_18920 [Tumidithrix elongata RA019]|uniref:HIRAN domain-containing protein n=1 Tax=Tumidithrix elongata BACA0141 TaxID=2716417 RepID=A0AAW9PV51_9CYAN|nr:hypothetical protein [Tumidithrix elongata RA019]
MPNRKPIGNLQMWAYKQFTKTGELIGYIPNKSLRIPEKNLGVKFTSAIASSNWSYLNKQ